MSHGLRVAERAAGPGLDDAGHLAANPYLDMACRGAVLVDLARRAASRTTGSAVSSASQTALWSGIPF